MFETDEKYLLDEEFRHDDALHCWAAFNHTGENEWFYLMREIRELGESRYERVLVSRTAFLHSHILADRPNSYVLSIQLVSPPSMNLGEAWRMDLLKSISLCTQGYIYELEDGSIYPLSHAWLLKGARVIWEKKGLSHYIPIK